MSEERAAEVEPWLRETLTDVEPVARGVLHALELAKEDLKKWCRDLTEEQLNRRPGGLASVAFQLRHISRSLDRLLTYAEGAALTEEQVSNSKTEMEEGAKRDEYLENLRQRWNGVHGECGRWRAVIIPQRGW
ncbi:MAG TPA: DinB family protein [Candidatus Acidoferrum sp.]